MSFVSFGDPVYQVLIAQVLHFLLENTFLSRIFCMSEIQILNVHLQVGVSFPMAEGWNGMSFKVSPKLNHSTINPKSPFQDPAYTCISDVIDQISGAKLTLL